MGSAETVPPLTFATIYLAHFSVREFLSATAPPHFFGGISAVPISEHTVHHNHPTMLCPQYLQYNKAWVDKDSASNVSPVIRSTARQWHQHLHQNGGSHAEVLALEHQFFG
jgi:hypothetical protein